MLPVEPRTGERSARQVAANREATIPLILDEVLRQRKEQDDRLEYLRRIAGLFLSIFLPGSAFVVFGLDDPVNLAAAIMAGVLFVGGVGAAIAVMRPRPWRQGPNVMKLFEGPYRLGDSLHNFTFVLTRLHEDVFRFNEFQVRRVQGWLAVTIAYFVMSAGLLGLGLLVG